MALALGSQSATVEVVGSTTRYNTEAKIFLFPT